MNGRSCTTSTTLFVEYRLFIYLTRANSIEMNTLKNGVAFESVGNLFLNGKAPYISIRLATDAIIVKYAVAAMKVCRPQLRY